MSDFVLWGIHPRYAGGVAIRLEAGSFRSCRGELRRRTTDGGWTRLAILTKCERWGSAAHGQPDHVCQAPTNRSQK